MDNHEKGMLMTTLDETGKWKDRHLSFAGWISDSPRWRIFQNEWDEVLSRFPGITAIHMSSLMSVASEDKYEDHVFSKRRSRQTLIEECVNVIAKNTLELVACGVDCEAYSRIMDKRAQKQIGRNAHVFVFRRVMKHIADRLKDIHWPYPTALIFDDNREYGAECYEHYSRSREAIPEFRKTFGSIAFVDDELYPPMQAADILAWLLRKQHMPYYDGVFDETIDKLVNGKTVETFYYDDVALTELNRKLLDPDL